jgi:hypothetical protein
MRTKRSVHKANLTSIGRNHLTSRDHERGSPLYIGVILPECKENRGNSKGPVESKGAGQRVFTDAGWYSPEIPTTDRDFYR